MELTEVLYEVGADGVATVTINRPEQRNALAPSTLRQLSFAMRQAAGEAAVHAVVLTGAGDKAFCSGADLARFAAPSSGVDRHLEHGEFVALFLACERLGKPLIGCVNGHALAAGFGLALCCDLRIASARARLGMPEVRLAVLPGSGGTQRLPRIVGPARAKELILTGRIIAADEAERIGLVNEVVPAGEARVRAYAVADEIAARGPLAVREAKRLIDAALELDLDAGLAAELDASERVFASEDMVEGANAFLGKRDPEYRGR